jgi:acyl-CoA thioesterase FadM
MRWLRLAEALLSAPYRQQLDPDSTSRLNFHVWPTEIDVSIMNHAAILTVMEAGRIDLMVRTGFFRLARKQKWYFVSAALNVQYLRPLKIFQKASLATRIFHVAEPWIYMEQIITCAGKDVAACIVKSKVKKGRENVSMEEISRMLGFDGFPQGEAEVVAAYEHANTVLINRMGTGQMS